MAPHQIGTCHYGSSQTGHYSPTKSTTTQYDNKPLWPHTTTGHYGPIPQQATMAPYHNRPLWPHPKQHRPLWPHNTQATMAPYHQATMAPYPTGHYGPNILTLLCYSNFLLLLFIIYLLFFYFYFLNEQQSDHQGK